MINTVCLLILMYTINSTISIPTVCFVIAWISAGIQVIEFLLDIMRCVLKKAIEEDESI